VQLTNISFQKRNNKRLSKSSQTCLWVDASASEERRAASKRVVVGDAKVGVGRGLVEGVIGKSSVGRIPVRKGGGRRRRKGITRNMLVMTKQNKVSAMKW
jgi:hypothetical protein